jgi:type II secretory pathway pseudopilin PulG
MSNKSKSGFTIIENMIASLILVAVAAGLYLTGLNSLKMAHTNSLVTQARGLGVQKLEEVHADGYDTVLLIAPYDPVTNTLMGAYEVVRNVEIVGHAVAGTVVGDLNSAAYLELRVVVDYPLPRSSRRLTNMYATIIHP